MAHAGSRLMSQWRVLLAGSDAAPEPRSGHAVALLRPSTSALLFGGSDGDIFFNDFYVLEPAAFARDSQDSQQESAPLSLELSAIGDLAGLSQSSTSSSSSEGGNGSDAEPPPLPELAWKRLVVTYAPCHQGDGSGGSTDATTSNSQDDELPYVGGGRDYHSMHYVPAPREEERRAGLRVLVFGNILVSTEHDPKSFEIDEFRVEEVRVHQPMLEAQWVPRRFGGAWKPRARQGHCSVLVDDKIFCFGGKNAATTMFYNDMFYFDVRRNVWVNPQPTGSFPAPRSYAGMAAGRDKIFVYGGYDGRQQFGGIYAFDVARSRWDKVAAAGEKPTARMNHSLTFVPPNHLVMFGGREHSRRQNDVSLFDISTESWKQLSPDSNALGGRAIIRGALGSSRSARERAAGHSPMGRTAHAAVHFDAVWRPRAQPDAAPTAERLLIFGGYGGSLKWLNDLQLLTIPAIAFKPSVTPEDVSSVSTVTTLVEGPPASQSGRALLSRPEEEKARSQSAPAQLSQPHPRPPSRAENLSVLSDITNQTAPVPHLALYAPAASSDAASTVKPPLKTASASSSSQSSSQSSARELKKRKRQGDSQDPPLSGNELLSSQIGTQTALIQLLQHNERHEDVMSKVLTLLEREQALRGQDDPARLQLATQVEALEAQLSAADHKIAALERKLRLSDAEKLEAREHLVAAEGELFAYRKIHAELPAFKAEILDALKKTNQYQFEASNLIENRLSSIHNAVEELRHYTGERTETDDSPQKKDSMFPDDAKSDSSSQPHLYPERVVINLEERLRSALASNEDMAEKLKAMEARLKRAEGHSEQIRQLSLAWMRDGADAS
ncbi:hypothetical protein PybrP1_005218 [[Pythium] brassicae (nom. inval.)]|nr:hypothetical protein PybrP1_005218 [[Pythium] brassicae (nom. inval.)]